MKYWPFKSFALIQHFNKQEKFFKGITLQLHAVRMVVPYSEKTHQILHIPFKEAFFPLTSKLVLLKSTFVIRPTIEFQLIHFYQNLMTGFVSRSMHLFSP